MTVGDSKEYPSILLGELMPLEAGDEQTGRNGENVHQRIEFKIPDIRIAHENKAERIDYYLFFSRPVEQIFQDGITEGNLPANLATKLSPVIEHHTSNVGQNPYSTGDAAFRLFNGFVPLSILAAMAFQSHNRWPYIATAAATLPLSLARFTFSKRSRTESSRRIAFSQAGGWGVVAAIGGIACATVVRALGH